jgi:hypothetical protein
VYRSSNGADPYTQRGGNLETTAYNDTGLNADTTYWYKVSAYNNAGETKSDAVSKKTAALPLPGTPTGLSAAGSTASTLSLTWDAVSGAAYYKVYRSSTGADPYARIGGNIETTSYDDTGLNADTAYWYKVGAYNAAGDGPQSTAIQARTAMPPGHYYVRAGALGDGSTWSNASGDLQLMIDTAYDAKTTNDNVAVVHVGAGTYKPKYAPTGNPITRDPSPADARDKSFFLRQGVQVLGGYTATGENIDESTRHTRFYTNADYKLNPDHRPGEVKNPAHQAILSGDHTGNDTGSAADGFAGMGDNAYHVLISLNIPANDNGATVFDGFTVKGGNATGSGYVSVGGMNIVRTGGGGMFNYNSSPTLGNVTFTGNNGSYCGGVSSYASYGTCSPVLTNVTIAGNTASNTGGGMANNVNISGTCLPVLTNVIITGNTANTGGGMYSDTNSGTCSPVLTNVTIAGNTASSQGGGMYNIVQGSSAVCSPVLTNVTIAGNTAGNGGGMYNSDSSSPVLTNVTIAGNTANTGGGMYNFGSPVLTNVTIAGNTAGGGGGGGMYNTGSTAKPRIRNSIIWGNAGTNPGIYNYNSASTTVTYSIVQGGHAGTGNKPDGTDPLFIDPEPAANAPTTAGNYRLQPGSPAINAGSNSYYSSGTPDLQSITTDLDGNPRFVGTVDMGAYEKQP